MAILIKDAETDRIVRELAARTGRTIKDAVRIAAERELAAIAPSKGRIDRDRLEHVLAELRSYPVTDDRSVDELLGYDDNGLPTSSSSTAPLSSQLPWMSPRPPISTHS